MSNERENVTSRKSSRISNVLFDSDSSVIIGDESTDLTSISGVGEERAERLRQAGIHTIKDIRMASEADLKAISTIGEGTAGQIVAGDVSDLNGVGKQRADRLREAGFLTARDICIADPDDLTAISGVGDTLAYQLKIQAEGYEIADEQTDSPATARNQAREHSNRANGKITRNNLTKTSGILGTYLYDKALINYLKSGERPEYFFRNRSAGFQITTPDGSKSTPHHGSDGRKYLLVTNYRVIYVAGCANGDDFYDFSYYRLSGVEAETDGTNATLTLKHTDGRSFKFDANKNAAETAEASRYVQNRVELATQQAWFETRTELTEELEIVTQDIEFVESMAIWNPRKSSEPLKQLNGHLEDVKQTADEYGFEDVRTEIEAAETKISSLKQKRKFDDALESVAKADTFLSKVEQHIEADEYQEVSDLLPEIERLVESVTPLNLDRDILDEAKDVSAIKQRCEDLRARHKQVQERYQSFRGKKELLDERADSITGELDDADRLIRDNQFEQSEITLNEAAAEISEIKGKLTESRFEFDAISNRLSEVKQRHASLVSKREQQAEERKSTFEQIEALEVKINRVESFIQHDDLKKAEETISSVQSQITSINESLDRHGFTDIRHEVNELKQQISTQLESIKEKFSQRYRSRSEAGKSRMKEAAEPTVSEKDTVALYVEARQEYEAAYEIASQHDIGDADSITDQIDSAQQARDEAEIRVLGNQVADISIPDPDGASVDNDYISVINSTESLLENLKETNNARTTDINLIKQEVTSRLRNAKFAREENRARRAVERCRDGDYSDSRASFETARDNLRQLIEGDSSDQQDDTTSDIAKLASICDQNASIARKADLGLADETALLGVKTEVNSPTGERVSGKAQATARKPQFIESQSGKAVASDRLNLEYDDFDRGEKIGSGGNANVYKTTLINDETERLIAVKEPRLQGTVSAQVIDQFAAEAKTWSRLDTHDHILSVLGYGSSPVPWIALEYMDEGDLSEVREELDQTRKFSIASHITDGVWHAHKRGIAHLDLKPQNILVESLGDGAQPTAKVTDWGLSKMLLDNSASIEGLSPQYSAPEQFDSDTFGKPDNQTDIFQLGTVFYELFTGQHPFQGSTTQAMHGILNESPAPPSDHSPNLPDGTDEILLKAISKGKSDRYEAVVNLRNDSALHVSVGC